jgi:hypothetical protein
MTDPLEELRASLMRAIRSQQLGRWHSGAWTGLLTAERYGLHFSVSALGRQATDEEVAEAKARCPEDVSGLVEITREHNRLGALNPYVRHFVPESEAQRLRERVAWMAE